MHAELIRIVSLKQNGDTRYGSKLNMQNIILFIDIYTYDYVCIQFVLYCYYICYILHSLKLFLQYNLFKLSSLHCVFFRAID